MLRVNPERGEHQGDAPGFYPGVGQRLGHSVWGGGIFVGSSPTARAIYPRSSAEERVPPKDEAASSTLAAGSKTREESLYIRSEPGGKAPGFDPGMTWFDTKTPSHMGAEVEWQTNGLLTRVVRVQVPSPSP